ncbi:MAG TPA: Ig-like domain-containing protein, partial [Chthoniobacteraceae bacterium]|nr:Ig-like domain-containing protein [Chthoniobacteraceae bacterium]
MTSLSRNLFALLAIVWTIATTHAATLATLEYRIVGEELRVSPAALSVPKNIAGSVSVQLTGGTNSTIGQGAFIEAILRGPSFPARRLVGQVNEPLLLPPLPLVGDYQLDAVRLVDAVSGKTRMEGNPASVPVRVFDEVLISRVTSRPLTLEEIQEKGIAIDEKNFRAIEFEVGFVVDGKTIPVKFPVVAPAFRQPTEIIPAAELDRLLAEADQLNNQLDLGAFIPKELEASGLNIEVKGINFQFVDEGEIDLALRIPPIPALVVIPGNVGFLNQFFSVQIFTENGAPTGSGLSVSNVLAQMKLPPGKDQLLGSDFNNPGDDPLRFARVGPNKIIQATQPVARRGADGEPGTADDISRLQPGETGQGEFLVEGLQEGLHVMDIELNAALEGLAAGVVQIKGKAAGSVLVRNPKFSMAFSHPRTIRAGEPYEAYVTILNTSSTIANLVQITLNSASVSGGVLESEETVILGTILPGETATAKFRIRAQRTGAITFSNLTTSDEGLVGRFRLRVGVDERGVPLSPDTLLMPEFVNSLPDSLINAANRVLGQALSIATAGQLPPNVKAVGKSTVTRRVLELAEAGQRVKYGDPLNRVLADLLLDWQGGRDFSAGFDQIIRETDAGREWREVLARTMESADNLSAPARLSARLPDLSGRSEPWAIFALNTESGTVRFGNGRQGQLPAVSGLLAAKYRNTNSASGSWFVERPGTNVIFEWQIDQSVPSALLSLALIGTNGTASKAEWSVSNLPTGACVGYDSAASVSDLRIDLNCDGVVDTTLAGTVSTIGEVAPQIVSVIQDPTVQSGRPTKPCVPEVPAFPLNYGTVVAVLFSKPMTQKSVDVPAAYVLDNGASAGSVQIQPGGRVALLNMRRPVGALRARRMSVTSVFDSRGNVVSGTPVLLQSDLASGIALRGRVAKADGSPAIGIPVTLTYYDRESSGFGECPEWVSRVSQVLTDESGAFDFDFVISGIPYSVSATDTSGLSTQAVSLILESTRADQFQGDKLRELANSAGAQNTLLAEFASANLPQAIAKAEGLDRALLRDFIPVGSPREGTEVPIALRFRGRGTVTGLVVGADGRTPVSNVALNIFPDPDSRELGRGLFTDSDGRFAFFGVPLGIFTIQADTGSGLRRIIGGVIDIPGQSTNLLVVLSSGQVIRTDLAGQVLEADNATPHARARVFVGQFIDGKFVNVVAAADADQDGFWRAVGIPTDVYDLVAVSFDGKRKGQRLDISAPAGVTNFASIALQGFSVVIGRVETVRGIPVANALVAGGEQIVHTSVDGTFRLTGVPTGPRTINAGVERTRAGEPAKSTPAFAFPRLGSAGVNVLPGVDNFVVIRFEPRGSILGRVVDETGTNTVKGINVARPDKGGFRWVPVNDRGEFSFEGIELGKHTFSAPAGPVFNSDVSGLLATLAGDSSVGEIQAAIGEAFAIFTGAADPLLTGEGANFNPARWGYVDTELIEDGEVRNITIQFFRAANIAGRVLNGQGVPIGARVRLTGIGPAANGRPTFLIRGEANTDPALGTFHFDRQAFIGSFGLQAASPFFPTVLVTNGFTSELKPSETNIILQFPPTAEINGRLAGTVFNPDGSRAAVGVKVRIKSIDLEIETRTNGFFDTQIALPALTDGVPGRNYFVEAEDLVGGGRGAGTIDLLPGITNNLNIRLLARGALSVTVLQSNGQPAAGARLEFERGSYPQERGQLVADSVGHVLFQNIFEGSYAVSAQFISGPTTLAGRAAVSLNPGTTNSVILALGPTGTIEGTFVKRDFVTPISFAQVAIGSTGFASTDSNGFFRVSGLPLGTYHLSSHDPVSGIGAVLLTTLNADGQTNTVKLVEQARGEIRGAVIASDGLSFVPAASVTLNIPGGITPPRTVTAGPDGRFSFPGAPAGSFQLSAAHPVSSLRGAQSGVLPENASFVELNVPLEGLGSINALVLLPDGIKPATNASVTITAGNNRSADVNAAGRVTFGDLPLGTFSLTANSQNLNENRSLARTNLSLSTAGATVEVTIVLAGVGSVSGQVLQSSGTTPAANAEVTFEHQGPLSRDVIVTLSDASGRFAFSNIALGPYSVSARSGPLGNRVEGTIAANLESDQVTLTLAPSGIVEGRLVRADGVSPVAGEDVRLTFPGRNLPGSLFRTAADGQFKFSAVPLGAFRISSIANGFNGIALRDSTLLANGETNRLGDVRMDEDDPLVAIVSPAPTAVGVPVTTAVDLLFNEALLPASISTNGIFLQGPTNTVIASVRLMDDGTGLLRRIRLIPSSPLKSLTTYQLAVVDGERRDAFGGLLGAGPTDLVGRPLIAPFVSSFTTADNDPPFVLSTFPTNNASQLDPRTVIRLTLNEPIRDSGFSVNLRGPGGSISGTASVGLNGIVLTFGSATDLPPNATLTLTLSNVFDLAGNRAIGDPFTLNFSTLDTLGPNIAALALAAGESPIAGSTVAIEATLAAAEPGVSVRFSRDFTPIAVDSVAPFRANAELPFTGTTTIRAIATDRFGNDGPVRELQLSVVPNQPPTVQLTRVVPASGALTNRQSFSLRLTATDDATITNVALVGIGVLPFATNFAIGTERTLTFTVPENASPAQTFRFIAQATDELGMRSPEVVLDLALVDSSPPSVRIISPAPQTLLDLSAGLNLLLSSSDNGGPHTLEVLASGGIISTQRLDLTTPAGNLVTNLITVPLTAASTAGGTLSILVRATDTAGNISTAARDFILPDLEPPRLQIARPADGSTNRSLWTRQIEFRFNEPLDPDTVTPANIRFTNDVALALSYDLALSDDRRTLFLRPSQPLPPATTFTNTILPALTDSFGNPWRDASGNSIPNQGLSFTFRTAAIIQSTPGPNTSVIAGQAVNSSIQFESGLGARRVRFVVNSGPPAEVSVPLGTFTASATVNVPSGATEAILRIFASDSDSFSDPVLLRSIDLSVQSIGLDTDGDGMPDSFELLHSFNPFDAADAILDADSDQLNNRQEFTTGTNPRDSDSDDDSILDGVDPKPLQINLPPSLAFAAQHGATFFDGVDDFLQSDSPSATLNIDSSSWSVAAWVNPALSTDQMTIVSRYECGFNNCSSPDGDASA